MSCVGYQLYVLEANIKDIHSEGNKFDPHNAAIYGIVSLATVQPTINTHVDHQLQL
jgi:hypothetical protein